MRPLRERVLHIAAAQASWQSYRRSSHLPVQARNPPVSTASTVEEGECAPNPEVAPVNPAEPAAADTTPPAPTENTPADTSEYRAHDHMDELMGSKVRIYFNHPNCAGQPQSFTESWTQTSATPYN